MLFLSVQLFNEPGAVSIIVSLLESYLEKDLEMSYNLQNPESNTNNSNVESGSDGSIEDVIIKVRKPQSWLDWYFIFMIITTFVVSKIAILIYINLLQNKNLFKDT